MAQLISIQERGEIEGGWQAAVRFNNGPINAIKVNNPFSDEEEQELEWYFEEHLAFPFTRKVRAQKAAQSIPTYGEKLFNQVFEQNAKAQFAYKTALQAGLNDAQIEIEGTPRFHALHWEALKDPEVHDPLVLQATMVRKNLVPSAIQSQVRPSPTINLLVVTARPSGQRDVGYRTISRPLVEALRQTSIPIHIEILRPGTYKSLENHLRETTAKHSEGFYHVVHFDVHGAVLSHEQLQQGREANRIVYNQRYARADIQPYEGVKAFLSFESEQEDHKADLVEASELADLLLKHHIPITILNACQSGMQIGERETSPGSRLMQAGVQLVLAMGYSVTVSAAERMMRTLYQKLFENDDLTVAIRHARAELYNHKERRAYFDQIIDLEDWLLPVVYQNAAVALQPREFTTPERAAWFESKAEEKSYIPPEPTYGSRYYTDFQPLSPKAQQAMLANDLRGTHHLLMLDNLESITGAHLAIQHTLPKEEQDALRSFLSDLAKGKTRVLLGSRSGEEWLAKGTFDDNIYDLPGLDDEAASMLADRILEKCNASRYRDDEKENENLRRLIKLLDGFPLAMEVVLANLAKQTPQEILVALQAGDVKIDPQSNNQERTASILRCIDYSHSNLSPEAQQLLLCLAPFTSVFWTDYLDEYSNLLKQQPVLANLPFDRWSEVLREAQNWGLLSAHGVKGYLHMQPTLAYFLRNRLNESGQAEVRRGIETAFREHYDEIGDMLYQWLNSKESRERQIGQLLISLEYENLVTALNLASEAQVSIAGPFNALIGYFDATQNQRRGLELYQSVLERFEQYSTEKLTGQLGYELASALGTIANWQLDLKQYSSAEISYQKVLKMAQQLIQINKKTVNTLQATAYQQLGKVALEQRQWNKAEQYYRQALQLNIELNDHLGQALAYHHLGSVHRGQRDWAKAEKHYQQALKSYDDANERYLQGATNHQLGLVAQEQRQFQQAEQYYQQALQIYIEYNDRYEQAGTYLSLGAVAQEQQQWQQAGEYYLQGLQIFVEYKDEYAAGMALRNLARLWKASDDVNVRASIANALGKSIEEMEKKLFETLEKWEKEQTGDAEKKE